MAKFKAGDKVLDRGERKLTIKEKVPFYLVEENIKYYSEDELRPAPLFEVGDLITGKPNNMYTVTTDQAILEVLEIRDNGELVVLLLDHDQRHWIGEEFLVKQEEFVELKKTPEINDIYEVNYSPMGEVVVLEVGKEFVVYTTVKDFDFDVKDEWKALPIDLFKEGTTFIRKM